MWERELGELVSLARNQHGLATPAQVARLGISAEGLTHLMDMSLVERFPNGTYYLSYTDRVGTIYQQSYEDWLSLEPHETSYERRKNELNAVMSHGGAARLHRIGKYVGARSHFTVRNDREALPNITFTVAEIPKTEVMRVEGVPVTTPLRTIADLVVECGGGAPERLVSDAAHLDLVDLRELLAYMIPLATKVRYPFPIHGRAFIEYFAPDLHLGSLSPRNVRSATAMMFPQQVEDMLPEARRLLHSTRSIVLGSAADEKTVTDELVANLAADIVSQSLWPDIKDRSIV
ncbi:type IV toxin-antitoxin system AbiEi family antitoxin domain-containing protein [Actinokineospora auranticolor]|uniref:Uncharacterized protein n=1 Tax=Actinokineospora auranticolor TaxID=155976 RepID=A0A2S6GJD0_9PSEU|nr:type IV toxin-antitoxin system AbiEi family antitoxin domain-containing protein [Actinokineospora auranticolor]PPK65261.1 hypothetical protein CLV40_115108 [Actinokineospora auranticolor]